MVTLAFPSCTLLACVCGALLTPSTGRCVPLGADTSTAAPAQIVADTGDFAIRPEDWDMYDVPEKCMSAVHWAREVAERTVTWQNHEEDVEDMPLEDTLPTGVAAVARACGSKFTFQDTVFSGAAGEDHLRAWFTLSLLEMNDSLSQSIAARLLDTTSRNYGGTATYGDRIMWVLNQYLEAKPARLASAEALVAERLDDHGALTQPKIWRMQAHRRLLEFAEENGYDRRSMGREAEHVIALAHAATTAEWLRDGEGMERELNLAFKKEMTIAAVFSPDSVPVVAARIQATYRLPALQKFFETCTASPDAGDGCGKPDMDGKSTAARSDVSRWAIERVYYDFLEPGLRVKMRSHLLTPGQSSTASNWSGTTAYDQVQRISAQFWYPAVKGDTVIPKPGAVSLIVYLPTDVTVYPRTEASWDYGYQYINAKIRHWIALYGRSGLSVTVIASPHGHALFGGAETNIKLGQAFDWYYHTYLHMPVTVAIDTAPVIKRLADPDGRVFYGASHLEKEMVGLTDKVPTGKDKPAVQGYYFGDGGGMICIVDRQGHTVYKGNGLSMSAGQTNSKNLEQSRLYLLDRVLQKMFSTAQHDH